jgi:hypothetical protein
MSDVRGTTCPWGSTRHSWRRTHRHDIRIMDLYFYALFRFATVLLSSKALLRGCLRNGYVPYYHCQGYATAEKNYEYLDREPTKFHRVFCSQRPYVLAIGISILFGYHRGRRSSGTQPRRRPQKPGICNEMSHQSRMPNSNSVRHPLGDSRDEASSCRSFNLRSAYVTLSCL